MRKTTPLVTVLAAAALLAGCSQTGQTQPAPVPDAPAPQASQDAGGQPPVQQPAPDFTPAPVDESVYYEPIEKPYDAAYLAGYYVGSVDLPASPEELAAYMETQTGKVAQPQERLGCKVGGFSARRVELDYGDLVFAGEAYKSEDELKITGWRLTGPAPEGLFPAGGVQVGDPRDSLFSRVGNLYLDNYSEGRYYGQEVYLSFDMRDAEEIGYVSADPGAEVRWVIRDGKIAEILTGWPVCQD
ncbi:hypothetical protein ABYF32_03990 [Buchananella felis]|uniref:hypothetical protein n=1 Tax=Buchananella felis TaxID=3231492 RepID=UPI003528D66F